MRVNLRRLKEVFQGVAFMIPIGFTIPSHAQTATVGTASYPITYYEDSSGGSADEAIAADVVSEFDTKSFKIKVLSRTKSVYTDSKGARFNCRERPTSTRCSATFPKEGTNCITRYTYTFRFNFRRRLVFSVFEELFSCSDGIYILSQHTGTSRFSVRR
jgi:hypothetical protein